jgi:hypothetical protein
MGFVKKAAKNRWFRVGSFDLLRIMGMGRNWFFHYLRIVRH